MGMKINAELPLPADLKAEYPLPKELMVLKQIADAADFQRQQLKY